MLTTTVAAATMTALAEEPQCFTELPGRARKTSNRLARPRSPRLAEIQGLTVLTNVLKIPLALPARVLENSDPGMRPRQRPRHRKRSCIDDGIVDGDLVMERVAVDHR